MFDWDDLRVFLAAARSGSLTAAAQQLGIDPATVGRRNARLESALKSTLFIRSATGGDADCLFDAPKHPTAVAA